MHLVKLMLNLHDNSVFSFTMFFYTILDIKIIRQS